MAEQAPSLQCPLDRREDRGALLDVHGVHPLGAPTPAS
jgi:hypothetical protein